jgi:hypothetical protein
MKNNFTIAAVLSFTFLSLGFLMLHLELFGYGISFFAFLPFILGYLLGGSTTKKVSLLGFGFSFIVFSILLIQGELEGMVCILMAIPLIAICAAFGMAVKIFFSMITDSKSKKIKGKVDDENIIDDDILRSSILPFCILAIIGFTEKQLTKNDHEIVEVKSEIILPYSCLKVYDSIKSVDTLDAEKPFLMKIDLPVPLKCILEEEKVGGIRTCYFEGGKIVEKVTALEKGKILKMDVLDYQLTGRTWLGFKEAIYTFEELGDNQCKMTRITTYSSELYPRIYWTPLEEIGIKQEHEYVFRNLKKDLSIKYGG